MFTRLSHHTSRLLDAAGVLFTAARVAGAVDRGVQQQARDLRRLGIAPDAFTDLV